MGLKTIQVGDKYFKLTAIKRDNKNPNNWYFSCECGITKSINVGSITKKNGRPVKGCGNCTEKIINISGQRSGNILLVSLSHTKDSRSYYNAICDCGKEFVIYKATFLAGQEQCGKSCPLWSRESNPEIYIGQIYNDCIIESLNKRTKHGNWIVNIICFCGNIFKRSMAGIKKNKNINCGCLNSHCTIIQKLYKASQRNANKRNYVFELNLEEYEILRKSPCNYCGGFSEEVKYFGLNGIDRVDNKTGYTTSNCVPCCKICNYAKLNLTVEKFLAHIEKIHNFQTTSGSASIQSVA